MKEAKRLEGLNEYYFSSKLEEVRGLMAQGKDVINLGIGSPDLAPPQEVLDALNSSLSNAGAHQYQPYKGQPQLREAMANFYREKYRVEVDPATQILPLMGSKEGIFHISMAFLDAGDQVLIPNPGYPSYQSVTKMVGAEAVLYNLKAENDWFPDFDQLKKLDLSNVKMMWVNYPHMPTGALPTLDLFKKLIAFALKHDILLVNDNPYSFILNEKPLSILEVEGAKDVAIELNSLSKTFNMAGWRVGMLLGNEKNLKSVLKVKSNLDSGMFYGIQAGAIAALKISSEFFREQNEIYTSRKKVAIKIAEKLNCTPLLPSAGLFVWAKIEEDISSEEYIDSILNNYGIFVAPGSIFGSSGEGYIRISLCASETRMEQALNRITKDKLIYD